MIVDEALLPRLRGTMFHRVEQHEFVTSTNDLACAAVREGAKDGLVVVADFQSAGRGRLDRTWEARSGECLLASIVLRPEGLSADRWHLAVAAVSMAAMDACAKVASVQVQLKWPNDLLLGERKLAGVLAQLVEESIVVGIGVNIVSAPPGAGWLNEVTPGPVDRGELLVSILEHLDVSWGSWDELASRYEKSCSTIGANVRAELFNRALEGVAVGVDPGGRLLVRESTGEIIKLDVGDVVHLRRSDGS